MKVKEIIKLLDAEILVGENQTDMEIKGAFGSDMMSDVLAFVSDQTMLLTGLVNPQVCRTCEMVDIGCVVFVRGKRPDQMVLDIAKEKEMVIIATKEKMYQACGKLYHAGLGRDEN
ncbi:MAG: DRTGG domain-containing protein [Bacillota bacterium]